MTAQDSSQNLHPSNSLLAATLAKVARVEIKNVHYASAPSGTTLTIATETCAGYIEARAALDMKTVSERNRDLRYGRAHETEYRFGVLSHVCFPHLGCWTDATDGDRHTKHRTGHELETHVRGESLGART